MFTNGVRTMPSCNKMDVQQIMDVIESFSGKRKIQAMEFANAMGHKELCTVLHSMRRWYGAGWGWNSAKKILRNRKILMSVMDLSAPIGVYRGYKVDRDSEYSKFSKGDVIHLPVERNNGCSSWTSEIEMTNKFSGSSKKKIGIIVKLIGGKNIETFLAPPAYSVPWFNDLYKMTMGESHRFTEGEFAMHSGELDAEIVRIKK